MVGFTLFTFVLASAVPIIFSLPLSKFLQETKLTSDNAVTATSALINVNKKALGKRKSNVDDSDDEESESDNDNLSLNENQKNDIKNIVLALDTGASTQKPSHTDGIGKIVNILKDLISDSNPILRSQKQKYGIKSELVKFQDSKPSLLVGLKSENIGRVLKDFLSSKLLDKYTSVMAKKAAVFYRTLKNEIRRNN